MKRRVVALALLLGLVSPAVTVELPPDAQVLSLLRQRLEGKGDHLERRIRRAGNKTIEFEAFLSTEADFDEASEILSQTHRYGDWALHNINNRPTGGTYFVKVLGLEPTGAAGGLVTTLRFDLPLFKKELRCHVNTKPQRRPGVFSLVVSIDPNSPGTYIESVEGEMRLYPIDRASRRVWIYAKGAAKLKHWILYEALPDRLLNRETGERLQIIVDNYQREEDRYRAARSKNEAKEAPRKAGQGAGDGKTPKPSPRVSSQN